MTQEKEDMDRVRAACDVLSEHFDCVQIFATRHEPGEDGGTINIQFGSGNWFSRYGVVRSWVNREEARTLVYEIRKGGDD